MPLTVKTFTSAGEAANALSAERGSRYLAGGTLVMRAVNEGDLSFSTVVRATDKSLARLDATLSVQSGFGAREMAIEEFLASRDRSPGALVLSISFPRPANAETFRYRKIARIKPKGGSVITLAAHVPTSGGRVSGARVAYGAMAATAIRAKPVERALEGRPLDAASIASAVAAAAEGTSPVDDSLASAWYRREVVGVHLRRLLSGQD